MSNWQKLAALECPECDGLGELDEDLPIRLADGSCQACNGTGLLLWELTAKCVGFPDMGFCPGRKCKACEGAGRILLTGPALLVAGEEALGRFGNFAYVWHPEHEAATQHGYTAHHCIFYSGQRLAALAKVLTAVIYE
jgi:hypothetical protein